MTRGADARSFGNPNLATRQHRLRLLSAPMLWAGQGIATDHLALPVIVFDLTRPGGIHDLQVAIDEWQHAL